MAGTTEIPTAPTKDADPRSRGPRSVPVSYDIQRLLDGLRWRIRAYVWIEGIALAITWIGFAFLFSVALDYTPVALGKWLGQVFASLAGLPELAWPIRAGLLVASGCVLVYILYRWIMRRAFVQLADHSMAVLLERRFGDFHDSLVTSVELSEHPDHAAEFNPDMLAHTSHDAQSLVPRVRLGQVFNFTPLVLSLSGAVLFSGVVAAFAFACPHFALATGRIYALSDQPWPRSAEIEVVGIEVRRSTPLSGDTQTPQVVAFEDDRVKVAKGSNIVLRVRADASKHIPSTCTIKYREEGGGWYSVPMVTAGHPTRGFQQYRYDNKPFRTIQSTLQFDVVGFDHRIGRYHVDVVENPIVIDTKLDCVFPDYMVDLESSSWTPREITWHPGTQLPLGTRMTIRCKANKPLRSALVVNSATGESQTVQVADEGSASDTFSFSVPPLAENLTLEVTLHDDDDIISESSHRIVITAVPDEAPRINAYMTGIGIAVTPDVIIPFEGSVSDDYGVANTWIEVQAPDVSLHRHEFAAQKSGELATTVDFLERRRIPAEEGGFALAPGENNKLTLVVKATDNFNLSGASNVGEGERYVLDIVTPDDLLAILERLEAGQRRRVEQIYDEMSEARDYLLRVRSASLGEESGAEPEDAVREPGDDEQAGQTPAERLQSLRLLFTQRSLLQSRKSAQEVLGVAATFRDIRQQLINNRIIDSEDRKTRLKEMVADPLQQIGEQSFPELEGFLEDLEKKLKVLERDAENPQAASEATAAAQASLKKAENVLAELENVLKHLLKFESYNELLDLVRELIDDQDGLIIETDKENKKDLLGDG